MAEYIDKAKVLEKAVEIKGYSSKMISAWDVAHIPSANVAEVKHGKWIRRNADDEAVSQCSVCKYPVSTFWSESTYCPHCGAKMDGE